MYGALRKSFFWPVKAAPMTIPDQIIHRYLEPYYESFCRVCARQVGMAKEESGLILDEKNHICDPYFVEMLRKHELDPVKFLKLRYKISN
jgi:hypothetical protein